MKHGSIERPLILAVDDDLDNLWLMSLALDLFGFSNICIDRSEYVLEAAKRYQPELILLDLVMPTMDGIEVANCLKADFVTSNIPIIGITALVAWKYPDCLPIEIFDGFLTKPYMLDDLQHLINTHLKRQALCCLASSA